MKLDHARFFFVLGRIQVNQVFNIFVFDRERRKILRGREVDLDDERKDVEIFFGQLYKRLHRRVTGSR